MKNFKYTNGFLPREVFTPYADLDGAHAAEWLKAHGAENVTFGDRGTNGLAEGTIEGFKVRLSTNGYLSIPTL